MRKPSPGRAGWDGTGGLGVQTEQRAAHGSRRATVGLGKSRGLSIHGIEVWGTGGRTETPGIRGKVAVSAGTG